MIQAIMKPDVLKFLVVCWMSAVKIQIETMYNAKVVNVKEMVTMNGL